MKKIGITLMSIFISVALAGNCFAQYVPPVTQGGTFVPDTEQLGKVKGSAGQGFFVSGSAGAGLAYGGYGGKVSIGYNKIGASVALGSLRGTPLGLSTGLMYGDGEGEETKIKFDKNSVAGTGFLVGLDVWLHPAVYYTFSYFQLGKLNGAVPLVGGSIALGGHIRLWEGLYMDVGGLVGLTFPKKADVAAIVTSFDEESVPMGLLGGGSLGIGWKF
jgi:hypothetical protein